MGVGKTTMIQTLLNQGFDKENNAKIQASTKSETHQLVKENYPVGRTHTEMKLNIWDTPGGDHFARVNAADYMNADVVIMVYSIDLESTFDNMHDLYETARTFSQNSLYFLVGNKEDLDKSGKRQVEKASGGELVEELTLSHF